MDFTTGEIPEPDDSDDDGDRTSDTEANDGYSAGEDFMTDDDMEQEVEHEEETLRCKQTGVWKRESRNDVMKKLFGELELHACMHLPDERMSKV